MKQGGSGPSITVLVVIAALCVLIAGCNLPKAWKMEPAELVPMSNQIMVTWTNVGNPKEQFCWKMTPEEAVCNPIIYPGSIIWGTPGPKPGLGCCSRPNK